MKMQKRKAKQTLIVIFLRENPLSFKRFIKWLVKHLKTQVKNTKLYEIIINIIVAIVIDL